MKRYIFKRLLLLIPIVLGITFLSFAMMRIAGSDAILQQVDATGIALSQEVIDARREDFSQEIWGSAIFREMMCFPLLFPNCPPLYS